MSWDNYLPIYLHFAKDEVDAVATVTHKDGNKLNFYGLQEYDIWDLPQEIAYWLGIYGGQFVLNIDLDFFYCSDCDGRAIRFLSDDYFNALSKSIGELHRAGKFVAVTIALTATDELTGGWAGPEEMARQLCKELGHSFKLA